MVHRPVRVTRTLPLPALDAWRLVADVRNHGRWVPLTVVTESGGVVRAVSGPGARRGWPGFVDVMRVDRWEAPRDGRPGVASYTKTGAVLRGTATIEVVPAGADTSRVTWTEDVFLAGPLPRAVTAALVAPVLRAMVRAVMRRLVREVSGATDRR